MNKKEKLLKLLRSKLNTSDKNLLKVFQIVEQRDVIVFRMPASFFSLQELWTNIQEIAKEINQPVMRYDMYATVAELDNILTNIEWLWEGNIPKGFMCLVAGEPGIGKSLFVLDLARIITLGLNFPNSQQKANKGSVLWIDTEMKQQLLNERSKSLGLDRNKIFIPSILGNLLTKFDASDPEHIAHIISIIEDKKPELMVVDSLGHSHSKGENRIEEVRPVMDFLTGIARDYNMSVIVVHHLNKGREGETAEISLSRVRGSTDITATPVVIFSLERGAADDTIKVRQIKNNIGKNQMALNAKLEYHDTEKEEIKALSYSEYTPPPNKKNKKDMCAEWVVSILEKHDAGVPLQQLISDGEGLGFTRANIYSAREVLGDRITFTGTGRMSIWHITNVENDNEAISKIGKAHKEK